MAQRKAQPRTPTPTGGARGAGSARSRQRGTPVQIQPKRNVGLIAGVAGLALLLVGVVAYAAVNQGAGYQDPLKKADAKVPGLIVADANTLARNHVGGTVKYATTPPDGGNHNQVPQVCRVYTQQVPNENAVHSLEHGAAWITYRPDLPAAQVTTLTNLASGRDHVLMSPDPQQTDPVDLTAWGRQLHLQSASDPKVATFISTYASGPQTPEPGATCSAGNSTIGTVPGNGTSAAPMPQTSSTIPAG